MNKSISFFKAVFLQFASRYVNVFIQLILTAILARLLSPEEYGIMAGLTVFTSFFAILADMGFGAGIVQYKQLDKRDFGGLFVFSFFLATILSFAFIAAGIPIALFYSEAQYEPLCAFAAISVFFNTINMVPNGILLRNKRFDLIGMRLVITTIIGGIIAVILAVNGFGTYALVWNVNITAIAIFLWNIASIRGQINFKQLDILKPVRLIARYSAYQAGFSIINYFSRNTDHLIIGRFFGSAPLGLYDKAYKLTTYPIQFIPSVLASVIQPYLSNYQDDKEKLFRYQTLMVRALALTGAYISGIFILCGKEIVFIFYGQKWLSCVPLFTILALSVIVQMAMNVTGAILQSAGRTDLMFRQGIAATIIMIIMLACGSISGNIILLTASVSAAFFLQSLTVAYYNNKIAFNKPMLTFLKPVFDILILSSIPLVLLYLMRTKLSLETGNVIYDLLIYSLAYTLFFVIVSYRQIRNVLNSLKNRS